MKYDTRHDITPAQLRRRTHYAVAVLLLFFIPLANGQDSAPIPPAPQPDLTSTPAPEQGPTADVTADDGSSVTVRGRGGRARPVLLRLRQKMTLVLRYDPSFAGSPVDVGCMDGGTVSFPGGRNFVGENGNVVVQFSDAQQPGLYRLEVACREGTSTFQFVVPNPDGSVVDASAIAPNPSGQ